MNKKQIMRLVQEKLDRRQPKEYRLQVVPAAIRHEKEDDWWFVGVQPSRNDIRRYDYYDLMAQVSIEIEDEKKVNITLVPPPSGVRKND